MPSFLLQFTIISSIRSGKLWIITAGLLSTALGLAVIVGWYTHTIQLIQVDSALVPMQFNTAVGFFLCGLMLLAECFNQRRAALAFAAIVAIIGLLTLLEYVFGVDVGLDQLLMQHYITTETSHPGRMAPNTALAFFLTGVAILLSSGALPKLGAPINGILGSLVFGLGISALLGYMLRLEAAYGWGQLSRMAVHTASGFVVLGFGLSMMAWTMEGTTGKQIPRWAAVPVVIIVMTITGSYWQALHPDRDAEVVQIAQNFILIFGIALAMALGIAMSKAIKETAARQQLEVAMAERRKAEQELRQYEHIVSNATDMLALLDKNFVYLSVNTVYASAFGKTPAEIIGRTPADLMGEDFFATLVKPHAIKCLAGEIVRYQDWFDFPDTGRKLMDILYSPYRGPHEEIPGFVVSARDITALQQLQEQLLQSQKMESVGQLAGGMAHDFNNMLAVILGNTDLALQDLNPADPAHAELVEIQKAAVRSSNLTQQLLAFARRQTIVPVVINFSEAVGHTLSMLRRLIGENIALEWTARANLWPIKIDPSQLDQLLTNLCLNSRDAIEDVGTISIEAANTRIDADYCKTNADSLPGDYLLITVRDTGCGMSPDVARKVFEPFFTTKTPGSGTGLGLATVYGAVKQNGGFIDVISTPGEGSTFHIYFPRQASIGTSMLDTEKPSAPQSGTEAVLIVEDNHAVLRLTTTMLKRLGYTVFTASTPDAAIHLSETHGAEIQLLLTDVIMPGMNGRDLAQRLTALAPGMKTLFMSGFTADVMSKEELADQDMNFIQKPFSMTELAAKLRDVLHSAS